MEMVSEQQTFAKLRVAPGDCANFTDEQWLEYVTSLRAAREKEPGVGRKRKEPGAPPTPRKKKTIDLSTME